MAGVALVVGVLTGGLHVSPASAQPLPPIVCGVSPGGPADFMFCISHDGNGGVRAGALNFSYNKSRRFQGRVELTYHEFGQPIPNSGGRVLAVSSELNGYIPPRGNLSTNITASWLPGTYCARVWNRWTGNWADNFCVDTNGNTWVRS